jgi:hypothetical protein
MRNKPNVPREFWIDSNLEAYKEEPEIEDLVRVIEKRAYDALLAKAEKLAEVIRYAMGPTRDVKEPKLREGLAEWEEFRGRK